MGEQPVTADDPKAAFLSFYDHALPHVYGYLVTRCGQSALAEELTAETFLAAVDAARRDDAPEVGMPWIMGVARHKLADHWRRHARHERNLHLLADSAGEPGESGAPGEWDAALDAILARQTLGELAPQHRAALTLRYLDDLPVPEVAALIGRTVHATEALLVRARAAFRRAYAGEEAGDA